MLRQSTRMATSVDAPQQHHAWPLPPHEQHCPCFEILPASLSGLPAQTFSKLTRSTMYPEPTSTLTLALPRFPPVTAIRRRQIFDVDRLSLTKKLFMDNFNFSTHPVISLACRSAWKIRTHRRCRGICSRSLVISLIDLLSPMSIRHDMRGHVSDKRKHTWPMSLYADGVLVNTN